MSTVDTQELAEKVQQIYRQVAERSLAKRLRYNHELLDRIPPAKNAQG